MVHAIPDDDEKRNVHVIVCGWMNGTARHVAKYAALYNDLGFSASTIVLSRGLDF
ncbi:hypothetical protein SDRG_17402, partial [Saprolegnia diclina VS20]